MILDALHRIANHRQSLSRDEAHAVMTEVLTGQCSDAQIAALLVALHMKGESVEDIFSLTAGGTAVMAEDKMGAEEMLSLFYVDGDRLLMTHFCPSGNQPRMQATISPDLKTISFDFLDATNLPNRQAGHMHRATYIFSDADHYSQEWTWMQDSKSTTFRSEMQRKK